MISKSSWFARFAQQASHITGRPTAFFVAVAIILVWCVTGPIFGFSDTWQLVINTGTTIVTFLMVFVIQNTQNRDTAAMHIKIDELIRVTSRARNILIDLEELDDRDLERLRKDFERLAEEGRRRGHTTGELPRAKGPARKSARSGARKQT
jgi:low affinity Fe/Cu permease